MKRATHSLILLLLLSYGATAAPKPAPKAVFHLYVSHFENVLGTSLELKVSAISQKEATKAEDAAMREIDRMAAILSTYNAHSEASRWLATLQQEVKVSPELFEVLNLFDQWRIRSGGALDASAAVVTRLWKQAATMQRIPGQEDLNKAVAEMQQPHWKLDAAAGTAIHLSKAPLVFSSFVKSYIIQHAAAAAMASGKVNAVVVNIGGDLVVLGHLNETIQITNPADDGENEPPMDQLSISNKAVATSGNYRRGELINGRWYSHIIDPRTGRPADNIISATVVAPVATDAGALATAFNVMSPSESVKLADAMPGVEYLIITRDGTQIKSKGWNALELPVVKHTEAQATQHAKTGEWYEDFELLINLEINLQKEGAVKRPYVAVWIEDENHAPVRTVTVWHGSERYMNELKSWYLKYRGQYTTDKNFSSTVSSATRPAGKYSMKWDGKDDKGNMVKPGKYTVKIEISREHGSYQLMRQEIICDETPKSFTLPGNIEISSASLDYRKKTTSN